MEKIECPVIDIVIPTCVSVNWDHHVARPARLYFLEQEL